MTKSSSLQSRASLSARLQARLPEIEETVRVRINAISDSGAADPDYVDSLRIAVTAALEYAVVGIGQDAAQSRAIPIPVLAQARMAARRGVSLDTILRRCTAGYTSLCDVVIEEAELSRLGTKELQRVLRIQAALFETTLAAVSEEYTLESRRFDSTNHRRRRLVERLLAGNPPDTDELNYNFDSWHLGLLAAGPRASEVLRRISGAIECPILLIADDDSTVWAWLRSNRPSELSEQDVRLACSHWSERTVAAIGEPGKGMSGWRLTHEQARAALPLARRGLEIVRYGNAAMLTSILQDEVLGRSLRQLYLAPLEHDRDGGAAAKETLRAYCASERSVVSAATSLGVSRRTVANRLQKIEGTLGRSLDSALAEIDAALRLEELGVLPGSAGR